MKPCLSKKIPEDLRSIVVDLHKAGKDNKIVKLFIGPYLDIFSIKIANLVLTISLQRGPPEKMSQKAQRRTINEVKKNPRVTSEDL